MATLDEQMAERREASGYSKTRKQPPHHPDPSTFDADELVTPSGKRIRVTDDEFAVMLERAGGFKTRLAKQLGVTLSAVSHRIKRSKYLSEVCRTVEETVLDLAEAQLIKAAQNGEPWAITFILKCKGKKRGWVERTELAFGGDPEALPPPIVLGVHDAGYIEAERERQKRELEELAEAAVIELRPEDASEGAEDGETWAATAQPSGAGTGEGAADAATGGTTGAESPQTAPEAAQSAPCNAEASAQEGGADAPQTPPPPPPQPRVPRTPSEAAAMRREQEAKGHAAQGGAQNAGPTGQAAHPYRGVPVTFPRR